MLYMLLIVGISGLVLKVFQQQRRIKQLCYCVTFGCLSRQGMTIVWRGVEKRRGRSLVCLDLDGMHQLNTQYGYSEVDRRIRTACTEFGSSIARWYSGDEFVIVCADGDTETTGVLITKLFGQQGIELTWASVPLSGDKLEASAKKGFTQVSKLKSLKEPNKKQATSEEVSCESLNIVGSPKGSFLKAVC